MLGAVTVYALDEKRKRKEEEAQQAAQVQAEVDAKNAEYQADLQAKIAAREALKIQGWLDSHSTLTALIRKRRNKARLIKRSLNSESKGQRKAWA